MMMPPNEMMTPKMRRKTEHEEKIKTIFHNALHGEIWVSINEIYPIDGTLDELETSTAVAKLTILTEAMVEYDESFFLEETLHKPKGYRPYFYNYIVYMDANSQMSDYSRLTQMGDSWYLASFDRQNNSDWFEYRGETQICASPVQMKKKRIYLSRKLLDEKTKEKISRLYDVNIPKGCSDTIITQKLKNLLGKVCFAKARIYKIGNGNLINICSDTGFNIMYDIGYPSKIKSYNARYAYTGAILSFKAIHPNAVLLSHWDDDHIMGCAYQDDRIFQCPWIAPEITKKNCVHAKRLASYLAKMNQLTVIKRSSIARKLCSIKQTNSQISFYLGENARIKGITAENCGGMVIEIINKSKSRTTESLFCGDVPYIAVKNVIWDKRTQGYDNLLVPHHGAKMDYSPLKVKQNANAIVCGNRDTRPGRPDKDHENALQDHGNGYQVTVTEDLNKSWMDIDLM